MSTRFDLHTRCHTCHVGRYHDVNNEGRYEEDKWFCPSCAKPEKRPVDLVDEIKRLQQENDWLKYELEQTKKGYQMIDQAYTELMAGILQNIEADAKRVH
jgi:hypothetical protein